MAIDQREEEAIQAVTERLTAYGATRSPDEIEAAVAAAHASFEDRPVRDFVPAPCRTQGSRRTRQPLDRPLTPATQPTL
ncbi:three-helix bundle dimerization domain-containing protein [Streptomyces purpurascens]|uniref:three-helix bundle dimerization domain-containing protein n=1 Tax=Streptomyces purpurascens TaxID=1924 RepID=UPI003C304141